MTVRLLLPALLLCSAGAAIAQTAPAAPPMSDRDLANQQVLQQLYPARARAAGEQGIVGFKVRLDAQGQPTECLVTHSSGYPRLDDETCTMIVTRARFGAGENVTRSSAGIFHEGQINWTIPGSTAGVPKPVAIASNDVEKKRIICRRSPTIGSLVARERVCMTRQEWDEQSTESKQPWDEQQGRGWKAGQ